jgi:hypothetical protein
MLRPPLGQAPTKYVLNTVTNLLREMYEGRFDVEPDHSFGGIMMIQEEEKDRSWIFGTVNGCWGFDIYASKQAMEDAEIAFSADCITRVDSGSEDVEKVFDCIVEMIRMSDFARAVTGL